MTKKDQTTHCIIIVLTIALILSFTHYIAFVIPKQAIIHYGVIEQKTPEAIEKRRVDAIRKEGLVK